MKNHTSLSINIDELNGLLILLKPRLDKLLISEKLILESNRYMHPLSFLSLPQIQLEISELKQKISEINNYLTPKSKKRFAFFSFFSFSFSFNTSSKILPCN